MGLRFVLLGPLRVTEDGTDLHIGGYRRRAVLLRLLVSPDRPIGPSHLCEDVWDGKPPPGAVATLQSHISSLRKLLGSDRILFHHGGYQLHIDGDDVDQRRFETMLRSGQQELLAGDYRAAAGSLDAALGCWRGHPLEDVARSSWATGEISRLHELHGEAIEAQLEAHLALGNHALLVVAAEAAIREYPFRERLWAHLITALFRDGRQFDALGAYQRLRRLLADELGIRPTAELAALELAVLNQDPSLAHQPRHRHPCRNSTQNLTGCTRHTNYFRGQRAEAYT